MLNNLPMNFVVVGELELEQFVKAWLDGSKPIECEQDEHDEAREKFEGMAEYTEQKTPVATRQEAWIWGNLQANAVGLLQNEDVVVVCIVNEVIS